MHLRHIRPRSIEWYDALMEEEDRGFDQLSPEELAKLRSLQAAERAAVMAFLRATPQETAASAR